MSSIDAAANAFSADMNGGKAIQSEEAPALISLDDVFSPRSIETDVVAGGDDLPDPEPKVTRKKAAPAEESVEADPLYGDDPNPPQDEEEDPAEAEDDADEDDGADDEGDGEAFDLDQHADDVVKVMVDGKEQEVPLKEAVDGYIRLETFHQRLNKINEERGVIRAEARVLLQEREQSAAMLQQIQQDMEALMPQEPDWDAAFAKNPAQARELQKQFNAMKERLNGIKSQREKILGEAQAQREKFTNDFAVQERERFDNLPENRHWAKDAKRRDKDLAAMVKTAKDVGLTPDEIRAVLDSRMLTILLRASKYDRITAVKPKLAPQGKKPARPRAGTSVRRTAQRGLARDQQQLQRTGSVRDAAKVFQGLI